jgi:hypothetical protein
VNDAQPSCPRDRDDPDGEPDHEEREDRHAARDLASVKLVEDVGEDEGDRERELARRERPLLPEQGDGGDLSADQITHDQTRHEDRNQRHE